MILSDSRRLPKAGRVDAGTSCSVSSNRTTSTLNSAARYFGSLWSTESATSLHPSCVDQPISNMWIGYEGTPNPPKHSWGPHQRFKVLLDAPRPPWSFGKCSQTLQEHSQVHLKAPVGMAVHSGCYKIWLTEQSNFGAPESSVQICMRLWETLGLLPSSAGYFEGSWDHCTASVVDLLPYSHSSGIYITTRNIILSYSAV